MRVSAVEGAAGGCRHRARRTRASLPQHHESAGSDREQDDGGGDRRKRAAQRLRRGGSHVDGGGGAVAAQAEELGADLGGALDPELALFLQSAEDDLIESGRDRRVEPRRRIRVLVEDPREDHGGRRTAKGGNAGRHFVKDRAEREEVGAGVDRFAARLLGRHVGGRPYRRSWRCELLRGDERAAVRIALSRGVRRPLESRESEIEQFRVASLRHEQVRRLHVAVDDSGAVRGGERVGDLASDREEPLERQQACRR